MKKNGFIALITVSVISAVVLLIVVSISLLGIGEASNALSQSKGQETLKIAEACLEESLLRLRDDVNYSGGSLSVGNGSCTITVSGAGSDRTINVTATIAGPPQYVKHLQATAKQTGNTINLLSWQEV